MTVYLLHIYPPLKHARHYIGFTTDNTEGRTNRRIVQHIKGLKSSSPLLRAALAAGSKIKVAYVWVGADRNFERKLKNRADCTRWCPCCGNGGKVPQPEPDKCPRGLDGETIHVYTMGNSTCDCGKMKVEIVERVYL